MNSKTCLLLILIITFLSSCSSNNLNRDKASEMINQFYEYPNLMYTELRSDFYCLSISDSNKKLLEADLLI